MVVIDGAVNQYAFKIYVERVLVPELRVGDAVTMDNLSSHKGSRTREMIEVGLSASDAAAQSRQAMELRV
jgi:hypothetical protein